MQWTLLSVTHSRHSYDLGILPELHSWMSRTLGLAVLLAELHSQLSLNVDYHVLVIGLEGRVKV